MKFEVKVPVVGESISEVTVGRWLKPDGDFVAIDEVICEIESEKATLEIRSEKEGVLKIFSREGETVPIGHRIGEIDTAAKKPAADTRTAAEAKDAAAAVIQPAAAAAPETKGITEDRSAKISPVAARLLSDAGLTASGVQGSGPGGRITKTDARKAIEAGVSRKASGAEGAQPVTGTPPGRTADIVPPVAFRTGGERNERRVKVSTLRKTIARRLVAARNETAMLTTFNEVDMSTIMEVREKYKELFQSKFNIKLGFMSFFIKACTIALAEFPEVNGMIEGDEIVYHEYCDISIAVSTPKGLVVPVIFDADRRSLAQIEAEVDRLATKARDNKLTIEEMTGGTFSITNGGVFGSLLSTPLINAPQTAILGMHKIQQRPVALNGQVVIRPMMYLALSYDHRLIDGKESVNFLVRVKELLEDPTRMLLDV